MGSAPIIFMPGAGAATTAAASGRRFFTKSLLAKATSCPAKLNYVNRPPFVDSMQDDEFLRTLAEGGHQIGALARMMFPGGVSITAIDHDEALQRTRTAVSTLRDFTLYEAAVSANGLFARVDILRAVGEEIQLLEVKSMSYKRDDPHFFRGKRGGIRSEVLPYLQDVAFQTLVARRSLPGRTIRPFLVMPDAASAATVDGLGAMFTTDARDGLHAKPREGVRASDLGAPLLAAVDVSEFVEEVLAMPLTFGEDTAAFEQWCERWARDWLDGRTLEGEPSNACRNCEFRASGSGSGGACAVQQCWSDALGVLPASIKRGELVIDLADSRRVNDWLDQGKVFLRDLVPLDLAPKPSKSQARRQQCDTSAYLAASIAAADDCRIATDTTALTTRQRQWLQASGHGLNAQGFVFQAGYVAQQMASWRFPLNVIDFETARLALPMRSGERPYSLTAFQFSHHLVHADGRIEHAGEFLCADPTVDVNRAFLLALEASLAANDGTVAMWSPYEGAVLGELVDRLATEAPSSERDRLLAFASSLIRRTDSNGVEQVGARAMVDLCDVSAGAFFHPSTNGSNSIKKVLPAMLACNDWLRQHYSQPVYGASLGNGRNFQAPMAWVSLDAAGRVRDPYDLLPPVQTDGLAATAAGVVSRLQAGGAAVAAYTLLATDADRLGAASCQALRDALLRYCELDTLAMAMIVQGWRAWVQASAAAAPR